MCGNFGLLALLLELNGGDREAAAEVLRRMAEATELRGVCHVSVATTNELPFATFGSPPPTPPPFDRPTIVPLTI